MRKQNKPSLSKKQAPQVVKQKSGVSEDEDRLSFNEDDFLNDLENDQEIEYEDDDLSQEYLDEVVPLKDIGKPKETFPNKALLRQVNYVQEMPINIDYSKFDKLALIQQSA